MSNSLYFTRTTDDGWTSYVAYHGGNAYMAFSYPGRPGWQAAVVGPGGRNLYALDWSGFAVHIDEVQAALQRYVDSHEGAS